MITADAITRALLDCPRAYADCHRIPGALVYCQADNPLSHDSNHACIPQSDEFTSVVIDAVTWMYQDWGLVPRVYSCGASRAQEEVRAALVGSGYAVQVWNRRDWGRPEPRRLAAQTGLEVRELGTVLPGLAELYAASPWDLGCIRHGLARPQGPGRLRFFAGFAGGRLVTGASVLALGDLRFLDHVATLPAEQGKGWCQTLLDAVLNNPAVGRPEQQFLQADNPVAIHIYEKLGYVALPETQRCWMASLEATSQAAPVRPGRSGHSSQRTASPGRSGRQAGKAGRSRPSGSKY